MPRHADRLLPLLLCAAVAWLIAACVPLSRVATTEPSAPGPLELTLLHTNDTWGYTRPCG